MPEPEHPQPPAKPEPKPAPTQHGTTEEKEPVYEAEVRPTEGPEN
jgi:hypothetical protein